ncbi:uncharacterized protein LOC112598458 [Melanaphis sacchari]|uniref:uncharacterized protein LOC112598458 n=1 Tax=Melanaphis sacchari TaxID=742174 RepID=UPI000DC1375F|nr:uncharacterized protein LOC112598458 [Melanaphis sacchari]
MRVQYAFVIVAASAAVVRVDGYLDVLSNVYNCRSTDLDTCLKSQLARTIDEISDRNETYRLNRYLTVTTAGNHRQPLSPDDNLGAKFLNFFNTLQIHYQPEEEDGSNDDVFEGRKKKGGKNKKHKMGLMMGFTAMGMTIVGGLFNKMMMGGAISIALKALIIAKIALILAGTMAIKKLLSGGGIGSGQVSIHPSWIGGGGSGGNEQHSGYRRSYAALQPSMTAADALPYKEQIDSYSNTHYSR